MKRLAVLIGILLLPASAHANVGIGYFTPSVVVLVLALIPAILVEAVVLWRVLKVRFLRGLFLSLVANLLSTVVGGLIGVGLDIVMAVTSGSLGLPMSSVAILISLVPMFFLTWWIENLAVRRLQRDDPRPNTRHATLLANLVSYGLIALAVIFIAPDDWTLDRSKLTEAVAAMGVAKTIVFEHYQQTGRFPAKLEDMPRSQYLRSLTLEENGRIVGVISFPKRAELDGKRIVYEPRVAGGQITWICYTPDAAFKYLPPQCRQRSAARP